MTTPAQHVIAVALAELGTKELPPGSNMTKYGRWYGSDGQPWCLTGDTLVLCLDGYRRIEDIQLGDVVIGGLTGRPRRVTAMVSRVARAREMRVRGARITVTDEHPILVRTERTERTQAKKAGWTPARSASTARSLTPGAEWVPAGDLSLGKVHVGPDTFTRQMVALSACSGDEWPVSEEFAYVAGMYVADGHISKGVHISDDPSDAERIRKALSAVGCTWSETRDRTSLRFSIHAGPVATALKRYGANSATKTVGDAMFWARPLREAFIAGYLAGDGCEHDGTASCSSISPTLIVGIAHILRTLGCAPREGIDREAGVMTIEGREVNVRRLYGLSWLLDGSVEQRHTVTYWDDDKLWGQVRSFGEYSDERVYDLTVEDEHAFIANGIVVHNCGSYVSWCFNQAGATKAITGLQAAKGFAGTQAALATAKRLGWLVKNPAPGDIFIHTTVPGKSGHTGIVLHVLRDAKGVLTGVETVEGNTDKRGGRTGGQVMRQTRTLRYINGGFIRPRWDALTPPHMPEPAPKPPVVVPPVVELSHPQRLYIAGRVLRDQDTGKIYEAVELRVRHIQTLEEVERLIKEYGAQSDMSRNLARVIVEVP